jgi:ribosomal protein L40E
MSDRKWRAQLSDDGELPELIEQAAGEPLYCTQCGALNPSQARFCHKCGHSLEEQAADVVGLSALVQAGRKKAQPAERRHNALASALLQIVSMAGLTGLGAAALVMDQSAALIPIVLGMVSHRRSSVNRAAKASQRNARSSAVSLCCWSPALGVTALVMGQGSAVILLMFGWFLIEAVRAHA